MEIKYEYMKLHVHKLCCRCCWWKSGSAQTHIHTRARARMNRGINYGARHVMKNGFFADKQVQRATTKSATT